MSMKVDVNFELPPENVEKPLSGKGAPPNWTHRSVQSFPSSFGEGHFWISTKQERESTTYTIYFVAKTHFHRIDSLQGVDFENKLEAKLTTTSEKGSFLKCRLNGNGKVHVFPSPASLWSASVETDRAALTKFRNTPPLNSSSGMGWRTVIVVAVVSLAAGAYLSHRFPLKQVNVLPPGQALFGGMNPAWRPR